MSYDRHPSSRPSGTLISRHPRDAATEVGPRVQVDPRTHAKAFYQREPDGSEMYACYYNSNDDPTFQERYNKRKDSHAFVQSMQCAFVSHGGAGDRKKDTDYTERRHSTKAERVHPPVVVEEEVGSDDHDANADARDGATQRVQQTTKSPIVEEPEEGDVADGGAAARARRASDRGDHLRSNREVARSRHPPSHSALGNDPWGIDSMMSRMMQPLTASHKSHRQQLVPHDLDRFMGGPFSSHFFGSGDPDSPFRMMEAVRYHMQQQRAAMFGGVDPFPRLF